MINQPFNLRYPLAKIDIILLIKTLQHNLASISYLLLKTLEGLDKKITSSVKTINITIDAFIFKAKLCPKSILRIDKNYKNAQIKAKKLKKRWKKIV